MTLPTVTRAQLIPLLERLLRSTDADAPLILVRGKLDHVSETVTVDGREVALMASSSPLAIRGRAAQPRSDPLAVVTGCENADLGDDLVARSVRRKVYSIDRWETVAHLFKANGVNSSLAEHREIADALIEAKPDDGYRPLLGKRLDLETALAELMPALFGWDSGTLAEFLPWAETPAAAQVMRTAAPSVLEQVRCYLIEKLGPGVGVVFAAFPAKRAAELTALALAAGLVHHQEAPLAAAAVRLEMLLGDDTLTAEAYQSLALAAQQWVTNEGQGRAAVADWLARADSFVVELKADSNAWRSDLVASGFEQRLAQAAKAINQWREASSDQNLEANVVASLKQLGRHRLAGQIPQRVERLEMAARIVRRLALQPAEPETLGETVGHYIRDGAWLDRARVLVSQGDTDPDVGALCATLTAQADQLIAKTGLGRAKHLATAAHHLHGDVIGVEHIVDQIIAPVAAAGPTLVLVFDGMGWPAFLDVLERLEAERWQPLQSVNDKSPTAALATFPTVTEHSRTSLFCAALRSGDQAHERKAFATHPLLTAECRSNRPPRLFHKADLRAGGLDTISTEVLDAIGDEANRVVGLVLNHIDERLKDVALPPGGWGLDELAPLREVLDAARRVGRVIVITADHGHVLERHSEHRAGGGGDRWRRTETGPAGDGELAVQGPRVLTDDGAAIMAWAEKLRYGPLRNGYHGGITPAEVIVPVVVMGTETPAWSEPLVLTRPDWWYPTVSGSAATESPSQQLPALPTLFDADPISKIMSSDHVIGQLASLRLDTTKVEAVLRLLDAAAGTAMGEERVANQTGLPRQRMSRFVGQLQRLLNVDGYLVITSSNAEITFDRSLLETQLGL